METLDTTGSKNTSVLCSVRGGGDFTVNFFTFKILIFMDYKYKYKHKRKRKRKHYTRQKEATTLTDQQRILSVTNLIMGGAKGRARSTNIRFEYDGDGDGDMYIISSS